MHEFVDRTAISSAFYKSGHVGKKEESHLFEVPTFHILDRNKRTKVKRFDRQGNLYMWRKIKTASPLFHHPFSETWQWQHHAEGLIFCNREGEAGES